MRKVVTTALIFMMITGLLTGCGQSADIGKDKAQEIALEDAGLTKEEVTRFRVSKDRDDGESIYDVEFTGGNVEYDYEILASNGEILSADYEESYPADSSVQAKPQEQKDLQAGDDPVQSDNQEQGQNGSVQSAPADVQITLEEASNLALARVPGASLQDLKIELDYDDGRQKYEGNIIYGQKEYEFEIDANTGDFLEWKEERR